MLETGYIRVDKASTAGGDNSKLGVCPNPVKRVSCQEIMRQKLATCLYLCSVTCAQGTARRFDKCTGMGNGQVGKSTWLEYCLLGIGPLRKQLFSPGCFSTPEYLSVTLREAAQPNSSWGLSRLVPASRYSEDIGRSAFFSAEPCERVPRSSSAETWRFSSLLHKGPSRLLPPRRNWWRSVRGHVRAEKRASGWGLGWPRHLGS